MNEKAYWIGFNRVRGIGPVKLGALLDRFGTLEAAWHAPVHELQRAGLDRRSLENLLKARQELNLEAAWQQVAQSRYRMLTWADDVYPTNLLGVDTPPPVLYVDGIVDERDTWAIAIVGTRRATAYGREVAHKLATELARHRVTVVSGLALGIDTIAHKAALRAGGRTVAVLGSGVDYVYPNQNRGLSQAIAQTGAVISEYPLGTRPEANNFPPRNRIISGLSQGVIVVEAGERSGALITAKFAAEQGREVFAVPGSILNPSSRGCNQLIQAGAHPLLSVEDVLDQLNLSRLGQQQSVRQSVSDDPLEAALLEKMSFEPQDIDELVRQLTLPAAQISSLLAIMELKGLVRQVSPLLYVRA